jgi:hypothetical protein
VRATADRLEHDLEGDWEDEPRGLIGFIEVAAKQARSAGTESRSHRAGSRSGTRRTQVHQLLELLDDGAPLGVAAVLREGPAVRLAARPR